MAEGGYDEYHPLLDQEENAQDDDDVGWAPTDAGENIGLENDGSPIGTGEDEVYEAETGTQWKELRNDAV